LSVKAAPGELIRDLSQKRPEIAVVFAAVIVVAFAAAAAAVDGLRDD